MQQILNSIPQDQFTWFIIHAALVVPITALLKKYLHIAGTFLGIPVIQLTAWVVAIILGVVGHYVAIGALTEAHLIVVFIKSLAAGLGANIGFDALMKNIKKNLK